MNRALQYANLAGVLLLAALAAAQWSANRKLNLEVNALSKQRLAQEQKIEEQQKALKGSAADLDSFREQFQAAAKRAKETELKLAQTEESVHQLKMERDGLNESANRWKEAVALRDERLKEAADKLQALAADRNEAVLKFNELAGKFNATVEELNKRTTDFNSLVERYEALANAAKKE